MNWFWEQFNEKGTWLFRMMWLQLLWMAFTLLGAVLFGFFPATISLFSIIRKWIRGDTEIDIFRTFAAAFKESFVRSNLIGLLFMAIGLFLAVDLYISQTYLGNAIVHIGILICTLLYTLTVLFFFPTYVHYELKTFTYVNQAFLLILVRPLQSLLILCSALIMLMIVYVVPFLGILFAGPMLAFPIMWLGNRVFQNLERTAVIEGMRARELQKEELAVTHK
ncbi:YesL family protein [Neobacillus vireti]|uniref:YesL family protein n=1 Tax=Neobacillus vireti TaxID=220686 RepID=UPI003000ACA2